MWWGVSGCGVIYVAWDVDLAAHRANRTTRAFEAGLVWWGGAATVQVLQVRCRLLDTNNLAKGTAMTPVFL